MIQIKSEANIYSGLFDCHSASISYLTSPSLTDYQDIGQPSSAEWSNIRRSECLLRPQIRWLIPRQSCFMESESTCGISVSPQH